MKTAAKSRCLYCGRKEEVTGAACSHHDDLPALDPNLNGGTKP